MKEIEAHISGRVQMVMYRDFAQRKAKKLGLTGMVQNLPDGRVRVVAQGREEVLQRYVEEYLKKGPMLARVDKVEVVTRSAVETFEDFTIVY